MATLFMVASSTASSPPPPSSPTLTLNENVAPRSFVRANVGHLIITASCDTIGVQAFQAAIIDRVTMAYSATPIEFATQSLQAANSGGSLTFLRECSSPGCTSSCHREYTQGAQAFDGVAVTFQDQDCSLAENTPPVMPSRPSSTSTPPSPSPPLTPSTPP